MKNVIFTAIYAVLMFGFLANATAQATSEEKYKLNFKKALEQLDSSWVNPAKMRETANMFERLANYKKEDWLPRYYQGLCLVQLSWSADAKDRETILTGAEEVIKKAAEISKDNSEIVTLEGYLYQAMIMINVMSNGPIYAPKSAQTLQKAMELDPANPRPHYLLGQNIYFTPPQFGGGADKAKPHLEKAKELFAAYKPATEFHPNWGEYVNNMILDGKLGKE